MENNIEHPKHYTMGKFEVREVIHDWKLSFGLGNAVKYIARAKHKGNEIQDLKKAANYVLWEIKKLEGKNESIS